MENHMNNTNVLEAIAGALAQSNKSMEIMAQAIKVHSDEIAAIREEIKAIDLKHGAQYSYLTKYTWEMNQRMKKLEAPIKQVQQLPLLLPAPEAETTKTTVDVPEMEAKQDEAEVKKPNNIIKRSAGEIAKGILASGIDLEVWFETQVQTISAMYNWTLGRVCMGWIYKRFDEATNHTYKKRPGGARYRILLKDNLAAAHLIRATLEVMQERLTA